MTVYIKNYLLYKLFLILINWFYNGVRYFLYFQKIYKKFQKKLKKSGKKQKSPIDFAKSLSIDWNYIFKINIIKIITINVISCLNFIIFGFSLQFQSSFDYFWGSISYLLISSISRAPYCYSVIVPCFHMIMLLHHNTII